METIMKYIGMPIAVFYVVIGLSVLNNSNVLFNMPERYAVYFGSTLILYGSFRAYRIYQKHAKERS